jgi:hypothetical protein
VISVDAGRLWVNGALCPGCRRPLALHPRSAYQWRETDGLDVCRGRCRLGKERAPQKCCWVLMSELMTEAEYRQRYENEAPPMEPCPCCGGHLQHQGRFPRRLASEDGTTVEPLWLYRGLCPNPACPVVTVTHYPWFVTPYEVVPTTQREAAVRAWADGRGFPALGQETGYDAKTLARWTAGVLARASEVTTGLLAVWQRLDPAAPAGVADEPAPRGRLRAMFRVCDAVATLLSTVEGWRVQLPCLSLPRLFRPPGPSPLPVWT